MIPNNVSAITLSFSRKAGSLLGLLAAVLTSLSFQAHLPASNSSDPAYWLDRAEGYVASGNKDSAVFAYKTAINVARKMDDLGSFYYAHWDWQSLVFDDPLESGRLLDRCIRTAWRKPNDDEEWEALCYVYCNQAYHLFQTGQLLPSIQRYNEAYSIFKKYRFQDFPVIEYLYKPLGAHYIRLGDGAQARLLLSEALEIATLPAERAGLWNNLGLSYWDEGMSAASDSCFKAGLKTVNAPAAYKQLLKSGLAQLEADKGNWQNVKAWLAAASSMTDVSEESADLMRDATLKLYQLNAQVALVEKDTALTLKHLSHLQEQLKTSPQISSRTKSRYLLTCAKLYYALGQKKFVDNCIEEIFILLFHQSNVSITESLQVYAESVVRDLFEFIGTLKSTENPKQSVTAYLLACKTDLLLRSTYSFNTSRIKVQLAMRQNIEAGLKGLYNLEIEPEKKGALAWKLMEYSKALMLLESQQVWTDRDTSREKIQKGLLLKEQAWLTAELALTSNEQAVQKSQLSARLKENAVALSAYTGSPTLKVLEAEELPDLMKQSNSALWINTFAGKADWYFLAYGRSQTPVLKKLPASQLLEQLQHWQRVVSKRSAESEPEVESLSLLMQSLLAHAKPSENIVISADAILGNIPWAALKMGSGYLIERVGLKFAFSASVWKAQLERSKEPIQEVVAFAPFSNSSRHGLPALQFSEKELKALPADAVRYIDKEAQLANLRKYQNKQTWIHLSTHGWTDTSGKSAAIAFYDSVLVMHDLFQWSFPGTVFVLSACETYKGELQEGEGVMSMARQLAQAGANGMVTTLWKVNERSTGYLFDAFYKNLKTETPSQALRLAQLTYLQDPKIPAWEKTPYYWAGLVYVGVDHSYVSPALPIWVWLGGVILLALLVLFFYRKNRQPGSTPS